ncbi:Fpg/Nei family DNA glycosylase [soil metagenome]
MPELPEVVLYLHALKPRIVGATLERVRLASPFLLRSVQPPLSAAEGKTVRGLRRIGKRIVWELEDGLFFVFHLMIAGRFRWKTRGAAIPKRVGHAAFDFPEATLLLTEAGTRRKASLHVVRGEAALAEHDRGGVEPLETDLAGFRAALLRENRTLKRALTDPRILSGIGNAHSDEILLRARLSPVRLTQQLDDAEIARLHQATCESLREWIERLREETGDAFPDKVTAFHPQMAAHGKFGEPCPQCGLAIQRIVYANRETNYCPTCQTGGKLLADRSLSRLLGRDWPKTAEELEELTGRG